MLGAESGSGSAGKRVVIIGAGPAGLTAAYELGKAGVPCVVLEKDDVVGGLSRTVRLDGYHFDIGGHRFFTKVRDVQRVWREVMPNGDFLHRRRMSRIFFRKRFFHYPLRLGNALRGLGPWEGALILLSYLRAVMRPRRTETSFEDWVSNRFGRRLYRTFFKTYTEKVWGIPCDRISAEWAAQRIKGLSLLTALKHALPLPPAARKSGTVRTLIDSFHYPRRGPGMMWEIVAEKVKSSGSEIRLGAGVEKIEWSDGGVRAVHVSTEHGTERIEGAEFVSSMPVRELVRKLDPKPPQQVLEAASALRYRDFLTVALIVDRAELFPDNWIYIHDPAVEVGRIQNFKNWSPDMVPDPTKSCVGLEYFCFEGDGLWTKGDDELIEQGKRELARLGLVDPREVEGGAVVRMPKAYPVYDGCHVAALATIRSFLDELGNLRPVGRNGMHKYNNQDHSMLTAMLTARNILGEDLDVWAVNSDSEYHEEASSDEARLGRELSRTQPAVPRVIPSEAGLSRRRRVWDRPRGEGGIATGMKPACVRVTSEARVREED